MKEINIKTATVETLMQTLDDNKREYMFKQKEIKRLKKIAIPEKIAQLNKLSQTKRTYIIDDKIYSKNKLNKEIQQTNLQKIKNK